MLAAVAWRRHARVLGFVALAILLLGTLGAQFAVMSGEAAVDFVTIPDAAAAVMHDHEELAELARTIFALLTAAWAAGLLLPILAKKAWAPKAGLALQILALLAAVVGGVMLANVGHLGARLVHEFGVTAGLGGKSPSDSATPPSPSAPAAPAPRDSESDDHR